MFLARPVFAAELLAGPLGLTVPEFSRASLSSADLTDVGPTEYRADAVVILDGEDQKPVLAVVVEVQLESKARKRRSWMAYVGTLHARLGCAVYLLVVCADQVVADWCSRPVLAGSIALTPFALGPRQVPVLTDPEQARQSPQMAVLSAMANGGAPDPVPVFEALLAALSALDDQDRAALYTDMVFAVLPAAARERLEELMTLTKPYSYQSEFARRYFSQGEARGEARGEAKALLAILDARGVELSNEDRGRITACTDLTQLETWVRKAATATKIQDLYV